MKTQYLIIGGGVAGTTAAETIRQNDPSGSCMIISEEPYRLYSRIMLSKPNFFLGKIPFDRVWIKSNDWYEENAITLTTGKRAVALDIKSKIVTLDDGTEITYQKLLLAFGAHVKKWDIPGAEKNGIHYLRTLDDAQEIINTIKTAKHAVVVGGGFVGFEMCEILQNAGIPVTLILRKSRFWSSLLDERSTAIIEDALEKHGVTIMRNVEIKEVRGNDTIEAVVLNDGTALPCDMAVVSIGTEHDLAWIKNAGVQTDRGITTDEYLQTSDPDIFAAGDIAQFEDVVIGEQVKLSNWANAQEQGKITGMNMCGMRTPFRLVSSYIAQGFGISIAFAGNIHATKDHAVITRGATEGSSWSRIIMRDSKIVGATLINNVKELPTITKLIEKGADMTYNENKLSDPSYDLKSLL